MGENMKKGASHIKVKFFPKGCKWDNISRTHLLLGLFLVEYFLEYSLKGFNKIFKFFYNLKNINVKVYVKYFKIYLIVKSFEVYL